MTAFRKILVANRGEIAIRVFRTLRELGIATVAVYSEVDREWSPRRRRRRGVPARAGTGERVLPSRRHDRGGRASRGRGRRASRVRVPRGERGIRAPSRGGGHRLDRAAARGDRGDGLEDRGARAHACSRRAGRPRHHDAGDVRRTMSSPPQSDVGYPIVVKASAGGGGKGMRVARSAPTRSSGHSRARDARAKRTSPTRLSTSSGTSRIRVTSRSRSSPTPTATSIHLGERDCTIQRRHQKLVEETPSPAVDDELFERASERSRSTPLVRSVTGRPARSRACSTSTARTTSSR